MDEDTKSDLNDVKPKRPVKGKGKTKAAAAATGSKWSGEEDWALFQAIFPRASKIDWNAVSAGVGRDAKVSLVCLLAACCEPVLRSAKLGDS